MAGGMYQKILDQDANREAVFVSQQLSAESWKGTLANAAQFVTEITANATIILVSVTDGDATPELRGAAFVVNQQGAAKVIAAIGAANTQFSVSEGNSSTFNVFIDADNDNKVVLENNLTGNRTFKVTALGVQA